MTEWETLFQAWDSEQNIRLDVRRFPESGWNWDAYRPDPVVDGLNWLAGGSGYGDDSSRTNLSRL